MNCIFRSEGGCVVAVDLKHGTHVEMAVIVSSTTRPDACARTEVGLTSDDARKLARKLEACAELLEETARPG
jgi:hypothetical protein